MYGTYSNPANLSIFSTLKSVFRENDDGILADDFLDERLKAIKLY